MTHLHLAASSAAPRHDGALVARTIWSRHGLEHPRRTSGKDGRNPGSARQRRRRIDDLLDPLRGLFGGGGGGGSIGRWVAHRRSALWLVFNCFVLVTEQQRGVVLRFGQFARVMQPGPHFKSPWPIERVIKVNATQIKTFSDNVPVLTRDENIVSVEFNVQYRVGDPQLYLFGTRDADAGAAAGRAERGARAGRPLRPGHRARRARRAGGVGARSSLQASLDAYRTGLVVTELNLPNARPPEEVKQAFDDVNSAQQDKDRLISEAQAYASKIVPEARGQAARVRTVGRGLQDRVDRPRHR